MTRIVHVDVSATVAPMPRPFVRWLPFFRGVYGTNFVHTRWLRYWLKKRRWP